MATTKSPMSSDKAKSASNMSAVRTGTTRPTPPAANTLNKASVNSPKSGPASKSIPAMDLAGKKSPNPKTEFAQDMTKLDDVAIISDVLSSQKGLIKMYSTALCEVSCENLRTVVTKGMTECATDQFDAFLYMNERNQYPTEPAPSQKVMQAKQKFAQKSTKMKK